MNRSNAAGSDRISSPRKCNLPLALALVAGALLFPSLALAASAASQSDYSQSFASLNCGGTVSQSADYGATDRVEQIPENAASQKSVDYDVLDVLAEKPAPSTTTDAKNWTLYE